MHKVNSTIRFREVEIPVISDEKGNQWVSVRHACEGLGLASNSQVEKLKRSPEFTWYDIISHDTVGRKQMLFCIAAGSKN